MESGTTTEGRWGRRVVSISAVVVVLLVGGAGIGGESEERGDDASESSGGSTATAGSRSEDEETVDEASGLASNFDRAPSEVRSGPIPFTGDLKRLEKSRAEKFLGVLCPEEPVRMKVDGEQMWACRRCPGFTSRGKEEGPLVLDRAIGGDFVDEGERDVFVTYRGCEASNTAHGGAVIFRKDKSEWSVIYRHPGLNPQACLAFRSEDAEDRLICRMRFESEKRVIEKIVDAASGRGLKLLARTVDNTGRCPKRKFVSSYLTAWERADMNGDGRPDLRVEKVQRHRPLGEDNEEPVCELEETGGSWKKARKLEFEYHFDGERLRRKNTEQSSFLEAVRRRAELKAVEDASSDRPDGDEESVESGDDGESSSGEDRSE